MVGLPPDLGSVGRADLGSFRKQQCLYLLPEWHGHCSSRPILASFFGVGSSSLSGGLVGLSFLEKLVKSTFGAHAAGGDAVECFFVRFGQERVDAIGGEACFEAIVAFDIPGGNYDFGRGGLVRWGRLEWSSKRNAVERASKASLSSSVRSRKLRPNLSSFHTMSVSPFCRAGNAATGRSVFRDGSSLATS